MSESAPSGSSQARPRPRRGAAATVAGMPATPSTIGSRAERRRRLRLRVVACVLPVLGLLARRVASVHAPPDPDPGRGLPATALTRL